jgi:hypothetical protein
MNTPDLRRRMYEANSFPPRLDADKGRVFVLKYVQDLWFWKGKLGLRQAAVGQALRTHIAVPESHCRV